MIVSVECCWMSLLILYRWKDKSRGTWQIVSCWFRRLSLSWDRLPRYLRVAMMATGFRFHLRRLYACLATTARDQRPGFPHLRRAQQAWAIKVLKMWSQDFWINFLLILIKSNQFIQIFKKSYQPRFFIHSQVIKTYFLHEIFRDVNDVNHIL